MAIGSEPVEVGVAFMKDAVFSFELVELEKGIHFLPCGIPPFNSSKNRYFGQERHQIKESAKKASLNPGILEIYGYISTEMHSSIQRIGLLACSVFEKEIALHAAGATHIVQTRFLEIGLHDHPDTLRATLQAVIDEWDARNDIDAVALAYGLCGCGTAGLRPGRHKLVIPRAHDCITIFMGSKEVFAEKQRRCPTCYYYSPGWNRSRRVPGPDRIEAQRAELSKQFDPDDVEFLLETEREQWALHDTAVFLDLGTDDAAAEADYARRCADSLGWRFEHLHGDPALLRDLLWGRWDAERFQVIAPGERLGHSADAAILRAEAAGEG